VNDNAFSARYAPPRGTPPLPGQKTALTAAQETAQETDAACGKLLTFYCPLPAEVSPEADMLRQHTQEWAKRFDLGEGDAERGALFALTGAVFAAHVYPHARGEVAQALADYDAWAWAANDFVGSDAPLPEIVVALGRWERIVRSPGSWPGSSRPLDAALADASARLRDLLTPVQWQRLTAGQSQWLYPMCWEAALRESGVPLGVDDYLAMRLSASGAGYAAPAYLDATEGIELSEREWADPVLRAAAEAGMLVGTLDNDRYSYFRERDLAVKKHNLFDALRVDDPSLPFAQAVDKAVALRDRIMSLYLKLREQLLPTAGTDVRRYVAGLDTVISGNMNFAAKAARYLLPEMPYAVTVTEVPCDDSTAPPDLPTIAWWWDQLSP
jgi:hypothetical protein